jgi:hypothetical protein
MAKTTSVNFKNITVAKEIVSKYLKDFKAEYTELDVQSLKPTWPAKIEKVRLSQKEMAPINFHPVVLSALCGTLFGDASLAISTGYKTARVQFRHSTRQSDWFFWKTFCIFGEMVTENSPQFQNPDGKQKGAKLLYPEERLGKLKLATKVDLRLSQLLKIVGDPKTIQRKWLNHMNNYFLMTLWLDDGGLSGEGGRQGVLSTGKMPLDQAEVLANYFLKVWEIDCYASEISQKMADGRLPTRICIRDQENLMKFLRIIAPIIPVKTMLYKVCFFPSNNVSLQQRWASELKLLVRPTWHSVLDEIYACKAESLNSGFISEEDIVH